MPSERLIKAPASLPPYSLMRAPQEMPLNTSDESNRRRALLQAAARLFVEKGFHATTTRDIAEAVGMRSGSPFYHFRSKQELLCAAMIEGLNASLERIEAAIADCHDPEERLRVLVRTHLGNLLEDECHTPLLLTEWRSLDAHSRKTVGEVMDRYQAPWQETIDALARSDRLRTTPGPAAHTARLLIFGMLNWTPQWFRASGALSVDALAAQALALLLSPTDRARSPTHE